MVKRGEIWWAELPEPEKSEPGFKRPIIIIQNNVFNRSKINTIISVILTTNLKLAEAPGNILLSASKLNGLNKDSVINVSQIVTIDKSYLTSKSGELSSKQLQKLNESLKLILNID